ncbi:conserved Plasmodium protein, unknown function [Plasmodium malariae]|uniref:Uncharacterized protein n=1 Tax=Plasmodium malariae TaxID=5858 RepID=A0A1C3KL65_PLAMA|nr:conserved Plasmodium protein, unknown function [Plasmodium malariae]
MFLRKLLFPSFFFTCVRYLFLLTQIENKKIKVYYPFNKGSYAIEILKRKNISVRQKKKYVTVKNKNTKRHYQLAFLVFDIIKIFGRISDKELLGHVIAHNNEFIELEKKKKKKRWEYLFNNDCINFDVLKIFLKNNKFEWPLTINSGQIKDQGAINIPVAPIVYVENCRKINEQFKSKNKNKKINLKIINDHVSELPISNDAIQCVFSSFSDSDSLTKDHFINKIHEWAPSDVDWYTFVYNLREEPSDNIKRFFD